MDPVRFSSQRVEILAVREQRVETFDSQRVETLAIRRQKSLTVRDQKPPRVRGQKPQQGRKPCSGQSWATPQGPA